MQILKSDGSECSKEPRSVKLRLADVYKAPGQLAGEFMKEVRALTDKDLEDFREWFNANGYPVPTVG